MITHVFASIPVSDRDASIPWYEQLTGREPDLIPNDSEAAWQMSTTGWICLLADPSHAGSVEHTLLVDDLDGYCSELKARGIDPGPVETVGPSVPVVSFADPDGNRIKVGQPA